MIACVFLSSCGDTDAVSSLTGKYKSPDELVFDGIESLGKEIDESGLRHFTVRLYSVTDNLTLEFVGNDYFLQSVMFTPASMMVAGNNTYVLESSNYNGSPLVRGNVTVESIDNENYSISGIVWAENGSVVKFSADGVLHYEEDVVTIEPIVGYCAINTIPLYGTDANGNWGPIEGRYENIITAINEKGEVLAQFDAYTDTSVALSGSYMVSADIYDAGIMNNGWTWDGNSGGTILYEKGVAYYVTSGTITITDTGDVLEISSTDAVCADGEGNPGPMNFIYQLTKK